MIKLKFCGIRSKEMAFFCVQNNLLWAGINLIPTSRRSVSVPMATKLCHILTKQRAVGIVQNLSIAQMKDISHQCPLVNWQLHGHESPKLIKKIKQAFPEWHLCKAISIANQSKNELEQTLGSYLPQTDIFLFDNEKPGSGVSIANTKLLEQAGDFCRRFKQPFGLAGGINHSNVAFLQQKFPQASFFDLASGIECKGEFDSVLAHKTIFNLSQA